MAPIDLSSRQFVDASSFGGDLDQSDGERSLSLEQSMGVRIEVQQSMLLLQVQ